MIKLTKTELRSQEHKLKQLQKYLPTLQLKKMLLQIEVNQAEAELEALDHLFQANRHKTASFATLLSDPLSFDLPKAVQIAEVVVSRENIAGVDVPIFKEVLFQKHPYFMFNTPVWLETAISEIQSLISVRQHMKVVQEKKTALQKELREVSIRVNLFEKILIPRAESNIRKISIFLGDMQLAAVCQAKVSKQKILKRAAS